MAVAAVKKEPARPKQGEAAPAAPAEAQSGATSRKKGKKLLVIAFGVLLAAGGSGGAWWYLHHRQGGQETSRVDPEKPPVFAPLDAFTVNLQQEDSSQFAQVGLTLRMTDEAAVSQLKLRMPEVRDRILLMLSAKKPSELLTLEGKRKLATDIQAAVNEILAPEAVKKAAAAAAAAAKRAAEAAGKKKAAPAQPAEQAENQDGARGESAEAAEAEAEPAAPAAIVLPVSGVLFTSFIVQ